jgi:hypothetical protein
LTSACIGFIGGPATFVLGFLILPLSYAFGATPPDGSPGYALLALPLSLAISLLLAFRLAVDRPQDDCARQHGRRLFGFLGPAYQCWVPGLRLLLQSRRFR